MNYEITGTLVEKYPTQEVSERFKKREFVLEIVEDVNGRVFSNFAKLQLIQDRCQTLDQHNIGDQLKVNFSVKGNRWERDGKVNYITNLQAWRVEKLGATPPPPTTPPDFGEAPPTPPPSFDDAPADDLPF